MTEGEEQTVGSVYSDQEMITTPFWNTRDGKNGKINPFFDYSASALGDIVEFVPITVSNSLEFYDFDLRSGIVFKRRDLCLTTDRFKNYSKMIGSPNFTLGVVPRTLSDDYEPVLVATFGNSKFYSNYPLNAPFVYKSKVIATASMDGHCVFQCSKGKNTKKVPIILAVNPDDRDFASVYNLDGLSKVVDLEYFKAFMENIYNDHNVLIRVDRDYREDYSLKFFTTEELSKLKNSCTNLYSAIWKKLVEIRKIKGAFLAFMRSFKASYGEEYFKCTKIYRPFGDVNNSSRDWFFAFLEGFFILENLGYGFTCGSGGWSLMESNELNDKCNTVDLNRAFRMVMSTLDSIGYHYMTANDVYGWVRKNRELTCYGEQLYVNPEWPITEIKWRGFP